MIGCLRFAHLAMTGLRHHDALLGAFDLVFGGKYSMIWFSAANTPAGGPFANSMVVTVNFGETAYHVKNSETVAAMGFHVTGAAE